MKNYKIIFITRARENRSSNFTSVSDVVVAIFVLNDGSNQALTNISIKRMRIRGANCPFRTDNHRGVQLREPRRRPVIRGVIYCVDGNFSIEAGGRSIGR